MGGLGFRYRENSIDDRLQLAGFKQRPESICKHAGYLYFLRQGSTAQAGTDDSQAFTQHGTQINFSSGTAQQTDIDQAPIFL